MTFLERYQNSISTEKQTTRSDAAAMIQNLFSYDSLPASGQKLAEEFRLLASGNLFCEHVTSFHFQPMPCCMLIQTISGAGTIKVSHRTLTLTDGQLLFLDCDQSYSIQSSLLPWTFRIYFIAGTRCELFRELLQAQTAPCYHLPEFSDLRNDLDQLFQIRTIESLPNLLQAQQLLNHVLTTLYLSTCGQAADIRSDIPAYLLEMKDTFDHHYAKAFSLEACQNRYGISKYRLCREFSAHFGEPPMRYLNKSRIAQAKKMLLTSDLNVHSISSLVGFENVNSFIHLFKKYTGITPHAFRQTVPEALPSLHSPVL